MVGLFYDQYGRGERSFTYDVEISGANVTNATGEYTEDYSVTCRWDRVVYSETYALDGEVNETKGVTDEFPYVDNNCGLWDDFCSNGNDIAGKVIVGLGICATFFAIAMMLSQAPKFEAPKTWGFRIFLLLSGAFYIGGAATWYNLETCNNADLPIEVKMEVFYGMYVLFFFCHLFLYKYRMCE